MMGHSLVLSCSRGSPQLCPWLCSHPCAQESLLPPPGCLGAGTQLSLGWFCLGCSCAASVVWVLAAPGLALLCAAALPRNAVNQSPGHGAKVTPRACENRGGAGGPWGTALVGGRVRQRLQGSWRCWQSFAFVALKENMGGGTQINDSVNLG